VPYRHSRRQRFSSSGVRAHLPLGEIKLLLMAPASPLG
jgi:hypothetical protein